MRKATAAAGASAAPVSGVRAAAKAAPEKGKTQQGDVSQEENCEGRQAQSDRAAAMQLKDGRNAPEEEEIRQERQLQDQVREPLDLIDMPELVPGEFEVFVTTLTREVFMIVTKPTDLIEKIKDAVFDARGVPQIHQRLIFDGKQLEDGRTAGSYMMVQDDMLYLVLRLRGGTTETCTTTPTKPRDTHRESAVDVRPMEERLTHARMLYWKIHKDRRLMFVNRTDRFLYVYVFPGQEQRLSVTSIAISAPTPAGSVSLGVAAQRTTKAHEGSFKPATIPLRGTTSSSAAPHSGAAAVLPPFEVFDIWKNTGRRVHYMVVTMEDDHVLVWKRGDIEGGRQVHFQQPMFSAEVVPVFKKKYVTADGEGNALSVVVKEFL